MRAVVLDGSEKGDAVMARLRDCVLAELDQAGWQAQPFDLCDLDIGYCLGDFGCWIKTPGECFQRDAGGEVAKALVQSDLAVYLSRVTFGGYSSQLKKAVDRILCLGSPFFTKVKGEVHHRKRYERYPNLAGIGLMEAPDEEAETLFTTLVRRNAINLHSASCGAGVVTSGMESETMGATVRTILAEGGVMP